jgi:hypothetical protein
VGTISSSFRHAGQFKARRSLVAKNQESSTQIYSPSIVPAASFEAFSSLHGWSADSLGGNKIMLFCASRERPAAKCAAQCVLCVLIKPAK